MGTASGTDDTIASPRGKARLRAAACVAGLLLFLVTYFATVAGGLTSPQAWVAAVTVLCGVWWLTDALPMAATALVPFVVFPLAGVADAGSVAASLGDKTILLFLGGFILSKAAESVNAHAQVADRVMRLIGTDSNPRILLAFMLATAFASMWISNTATALTMLPVALAVLTKPGTDKLAVPLMLAIAYAASIGGIATPIGTPPNLIFMAVYEKQTGESIPFVRWMILGVPIAVTLLMATWGVLCFRVGKGGGITLGDALPWTPAQRRVLGVFSLAAILWITRTVPYGGWAALTGIKMADDSTVALLCVVLLFLIPRGGRESGRLLDWKTAERIQWGLLLLFAGGIALAAGFKESGLSVTIGEQLGDFVNLPRWMLIGLICLAVTFLTEVTSNTASTTLLMPILAGVAIAADVNPALLMVPAAISASCAFMLPVATPPNAVAFSSERLTIADMAKRGVVINLFGVVVVTVACLLLLKHVV